VFLFAARALSQQCQFIRYGGSNQLTDVLVNRSPDLFKKHTFDIQGDIDMQASVQVTPL
jgi:hypothetical protein